MAPPPQLRIGPQHLAMAFRTSTATGIVPTLRAASLDRMSNGLMCPTQAKGPERNIYIYLRQAPQGYLVNGGLALRRPLIHPPQLPTSQTPSSRRHPTSLPSKGTMHSTCAQHLAVDAVGRHRGCRAYHVRWVNVLDVCGFLPRFEVGLEVLHQLPPRVPELGVACKQATMLGCCCGGQPCPK